MLDKNIMSIHHISKQLSDKKLYTVAKITGLSYPTLKKMADCKDLNYTKGSLKAVTKYIRSYQNAK